MFLLWWFFAFVSQAPGAHLRSLGFRPNGRRAVALAARWSRTELVHPIGLVLRYLFYLFSFKRQRSPPLTWLSSRLRRCGRPVGLAVALSATVLRHQAISIHLLVIASVARQSQ